MWTAFDYLYRDAGNYKVRGSLLLNGAISQADRELVQSRMEAGEYFIAEQVGVHPLYEQLYKWSDGPVDLDHCWHEFVGFRELAAPSKPQSAVPVRDFVDRFASVDGWDGALSPHFSRRG